MSNELHLAAPGVGLTVTFKFGFNDANGPCARVMVLDSNEGKSLEMFVPVSVMMNVGSWMLATAGAHAPPEPEVAPEAPKAEEAKADDEAAQKAAEAIAEGIIKEVQKYDAAKKKKGKK